MPFSLSAKDLRNQIAEFKHRNPKFSDSDLFVFWFLRSSITDNEEKAAAAIVGGSRDKGIDAIMIDEGARSIFIVQGKYRNGIGDKTEKRSDVLAFASLAAEILQESKDGFADFTKDMEQYTSHKLKEARQLLLSKGYKLFLYYATTANCSHEIEKSAKRQVKRGKCSATFEMFAGKRILYLLRDYLDGVAPPIPTLDLEMESQGGIEVNGILQRYDRGNTIESWVFSMNGTAIARLFDYAQVRLFARNIRGFLGESTPVNQDMIDTIQDEPDHFFYYNNGITIVCDHAERIAGQGKDVLRVSNPQIINGQQTTRCLASDKSRASKVSVLVKVIQVNRDDPSHAGEFDSLVSAIVAGTNWQNAISQADLMSNDRKQIELDRALRKLEYVYLRKRQTKGEARQDMGGKGKRIIKKEELAQASAACELDPHVVRSGKDHLFGKELYEKVFPTSDPLYYLPRYMVMKAVAKQAAGKPQRSYAKWMATGFVWGLISSRINTRGKTRSFCEKIAQSDLAVVSTLNKMIEQVYVAAGEFYRKNRGTGDAMLDPSQFYRNRTGRHKEFQAFWMKQKRQTRAKSDRTVDRFEEAVCRL